MNIPNLRRVVACLLALGQNDTFSSLRSGFQEETRTRNYPQPQPLPSEVVEKSAHSIWKQSGFGVLLLRERPTFERASFSCDDANFRQNFRFSATDKIEIRKPSPPRYWPTGCLLMYDSYAKLCQYLLQVRASSSHHPPFSASSAVADQARPDRSAQLVIEHFRGWTDPFAQFLGNFTSL